MNKKEKEIMEKRVLESELECLEAEEDGTKSNGKDEAVRSAHMESKRIGTGNRKKPGNRR